MDLFNEVKNDYYKLFTNIINKVYYEKSFSKLQDLQNEYKKYEFILEDIDEFKNIISNDIKDEEKTIKDCILFKFCEDNIYPVKDEMIAPILLTSLEKRYLKFLLSDKAFRQMISKDICKKLDEVLNDVEPLDYKKHFVCKDDISNVEYGEYFENIKLITKCIMEDKSLSYENITKTKGVYKGVMKPYKLLFSIRKNKWQVIFFKKSHEDGQFYPVLANIERLRNLKICDGYECDECLIKDLMEMQKVKEPLVLEIKKKYTSVERCFRLFSNYEKKAYFDEKTNRHYLYVYNYVFDESVIVRDILSLGDSVKVISPENIREKIIKRLEKIDV